VYVHHAAASEVLVADADALLFHRHYHLLKPIVNTQAESQWSMMEVWNTITAYIRIVERRNFSVIKGDFAVSPQNYMYNNNNYYNNRFTAPWTVSGTSRVSQHQKDKSRKVKPIWIYWSKR